VQAQVGESDALPVKEAQHVVVRPHEEGDRVGISFVPGEHRCVDVAVRRYEREVSDLFVKGCRHLA
jgi:hypothetical protein